MPAWVRDEEGNLYGTTTFGGSGSLAAGTVFKLEPPAQPGGAWTETVLHSFCSAANCTDGNTPYVGVIRDKEGNLYGTTDGGGTGCPDYGGCGVVYRLDRKGNETVLYSFCPAGYGNWYGRIFSQRSDPGCSGQPLRHYFLWRSRFGSGVQARASGTEGWRLD